MTDSDTSNDVPPEEMKPKPKSAFSEGECSSNDELSKISVFPNQDEDDSEESSNINRKICSYLPDGTAIPILRTSSSRQGRAHQRWDKCEKTDRTIRLTTGCVPITKDGRILLCSSAKKKEWILPKGGWESDELMEESAVREAYEEAGVVGILGPKLSDITFETGKEKRRRLESLKLQSSSGSHVSALGSTTSSVASTDDEKLQNGSTQIFTALSSTSKTTTPTPPISDCSSPVAESIISPIDTTFVRKTQNNTISSPLSPSSMTRSTHALVRVTFFPLYISRALTEWPENGRSRRIFDIDEAIDTIKRPELVDALLEVKRRGLHKVKEEDNDHSKDGS